MENVSPYAQFHCYTTAESTNEKLAWIDWKYIIRSSFIDTQSIAVDIWSYHGNFLPFDPIFF